MACYTGGSKTYLITFFLCCLWEVLLVSGAIYGWAAIVVVFKAEGYFSSLCNQLTPVTNVSSIRTPQLSKPRTANIQVECMAQDERLNLIFTLSVVCLCCIKFPVGIFLDSFGPRLTRLVGCLLYTLSSIGLAFTTKEIGNFLFVVFMVMCCGGSLNALSLYQTCNIVFRQTKSLVLCILHGAFDSSAIVLLFFKLAYDGGISMRDISLFYAALCFATIGGITLALIPKYKELLEWNKTPQELEEEAKKVLEKRAERFSSSSLQSETFIRSESYDAERKQRIIYKPRTNRVAISKSSFRRYGSFRGGDSHDADREPILKSGTSERSGEPSTMELRFGYGFPGTIWKSLYSAAYILELLYLSVIQLKLWFFVGSLNSYLVEVLKDDEARVSSYINIFGYVQLCGIFVTPIIGAIFDKGILTGKSSIPDMPPDNERIHRMRGAIIPFFLTNALCSLLSALSLVKSVGVLIPCFFLYTIVRGFLYASHGAYIGIAFAPQFFGRLYGLGVFTGGIFGLLEYVLFIISSNFFGGDPFWMNFFLLILTSLSNILPIYLIVYCKRAVSDQPLSSIKETETDV